MCLVGMVARRYIDFLISLIPTPLVSSLFFSSIPTFLMCVYRYHRVGRLFKSRDEPDSPLTKYITKAGISRARYTITQFNYHHRVIRLISNRISV